MLKTIYVIQDTSIEPTHIVIERPHGASVRDCERITHASWSRLERVMGCDLCDLHYPDVTQPQPYLEHDVIQYNLHTDRDGFSWYDCAFVFDFMYGWQS